MKNLFFNLSLLLILPNAFCQVSGKLVTSDSQPIPFANVLLLKNSDSTLVKATLTDEKGIYCLENIDWGQYFLRYSSIGYQTLDVPGFRLTVDQKSKDFGIQLMKEATKQLEEVIIRAEKPLFQQEIYGTVVNVESSVLTKGSSALQVLERSPGVVIDQRNSSIALNGKNGVMVSINGKLMRMPVEQVTALLNSMSADDIEKIELLTTPPAGYDAEGSAGIINIVSKKSKKRGTNGSFSVTGGYGWREKGTANFNLNHTTDKVTIYSSYTFLHDKSYMDWFAQATDDVPLLGGKNSSDFLSVIQPTENSHNASLGFDVKLNAKNTIGANINYNKSDDAVTIINRAAYTFFPNSLLQLNANINGINHWRNLITSVYLEKKLKEEEQINFDMDYLYYNNNSPTTIQSSFLDKNGNVAGTNDSLFSPRQKSFATTTIQVVVVKIDYKKQWSKNIQLETGVKANYTKNASVSGIESQVNDVWLTRTELANNIVMGESIGAIYASVNAQINSSTNLVIGARYEYSRTQMDDPESGQNIVDRKLGKLFPSIFFSKKLNDNADLQLSFTKRISRPSYNDLASYKTYTDPTSVFTGNSLLRPTITNNLKLGYNYKGYSFSVLLSRDDYPIARYQLTASPSKDLLYVSPQNLIYQNNLTFQTEIPLKLNDWWSMSYGFIGGWRQFKLDYTVEPVKKTYFGYTFRGNQTFKLPNNFFLEISGWFNSSSYDGSKKVDGFGSVNVGVKKELKNRNGTIQVAITDPFRMVNINSYFGHLTEEAFSLKSHVIFQPESAVSPLIKVTYSKTFGSNRIKKTSNEGAAQDERDRIRKN